VVKKAGGKRRAWIDDHSGRKEVTAFANVIVEWCFDAKIDVFFFNERFAKEVKSVDYPFRFVSLRTLFATISDFYCGFIPQSCGTINSYRLLCRLNQFESSICSVNFILRIKLSN
jgi:hypothetical protein